MKHLIPLTALAALSAASPIYAQTPAFSKPSGYATQSLPANTLTLVGINLQNPAVVKGTFTSISDTTLTDTQIDFTSQLLANKTYIIEINSGDAAGGVEWFADWTGNTITVASTLNIPNLAIGDSYTIRLAPTLQQLFPAGSLTTFGLANVSAADKIWVQQSNGTYLKYAVKTGANAGWHITPDGLTSGGLITTDIPVVSTDGILVEKKAVTGSVVQTGEVKTSATTAFSTQGFNLVSINPPVGLTLFTSGLADDVATFGLANASSADKVWIPQGNGTFVRYALKTGANAGWYTTPNGLSVGSLVTEDIPLPAAIYIQQISGTPKRISLNVPSSYNSL
jgi:hypothetical protein